ncbi:GatB/YqeY domain-containing protein, partial [Achromobacter xylosoxidans]
MSTATLKTRLSDAVKDAMRAKATERLATLRFLLAAVKQKEVDER